MRQDSAKAELLRIQRSRRDRSMKKAAKGCQRLPKAIPQRLELKMSILRILLLRASVEACWLKGTRASCCYGHTQNCVEAELSKCCAAPSSESIMEILRSNDPMLPMQHLNKLRDRSLRSAAAALLHETWKKAMLDINRVKNQTIKGQLPLLGTAFRSALLYFLSLHALHRSIRSRLMQGILAREALLWSGFTSIYVAAWGPKDFCRCVEAGEFFSRIGAVLLQTGIGENYFPKIFLNVSNLEHRALSIQNCRRHEIDSLDATVVLRTAFSSQCIPGDLATLITLLHGCILEQDLEKVLKLHEAIFHLGTFVSDCLDTRTWRFNVRHTALHYARLLWTLRNISSFDAELQRQMAWAPRSALFRQSFSLPGLGSPWYNQCGPHHLHHVKLLPDQSDASQLHGPFCTELGRFWLELEYEKEEEAALSTLLVVPITMSWEANPWHHLHWWLPAIWYVKGHLGLDDVEVALVFPHGDINWAMSTARGRDLKSRAHTEPSTWSILQHRFPFPEYSKKHWTGEGLHADFLKQISSQSALALSEYYARSFRQVILGLPSLRSFLQTPQLPCTALKEVREWIQRSVKRTPVTLALLQRPSEHGRRIANFEEV